LLKLLSKLWHSYAVQRFVPAKAYIKWEFRHQMGYKLDLKNPKTFSEKLQWLKLYDHNPLYETLVDKYAVREYVAGVIGEEFLVPLIGVFESADSIPFDFLPNEYVLKCTHDSGTAVIVDDRSTPNRDAIRAHFRAALKRQYYYEHREWPYKRIKPRIQCEVLLKQDGLSRVYDYKFPCFHGECDRVMVGVGRETGHVKWYLYDEAWHIHPFTSEGQPPTPDVALAPPSKLKQMFEIARRLSSDYPFVRVDLYCTDDSVYFSEITFFPQAGYYHSYGGVEKPFGERIDLGLAYGKG
jgi:hypothetical protein